MPQSPFPQVPPEHVLTVHDVSNIYHVPLLLESQGKGNVVLCVAHSTAQHSSRAGRKAFMSDAHTIHLSCASRVCAGTARIIANKLKINLPQQPQLALWRSLAAAVDNASIEVRIALVGKYTGE